MISYPQFLLWLHMMAMASYFGAQFAVIYMLIPAAQTAPDEDSRRRVLIQGFKFYNPYMIGVLGAIVISGAWQLTELKATLKFKYFSALSGPLSLKLGLAFALIFIQTYITFGLAFRIGRQEEVAAHGDGEPFSVEQIDSMLRRIVAMCWVRIVLGAAIVMVSLTMMRRAVDEGTASAACSPARAADLSSATRAEVGFQLGEGEERGHDVRQGYEPEQESGKLAQRGVVRNTRRVRSGSLLDDLVSLREFGAIDGSVHGSASR